MTMKKHPLMNSDAAIAFNRLGEESTDANSHCPDPTGSVPTHAEVLKAIYESGVHQENPHMIKYLRRDGKIVEEPSRYAMNFAKRLAQNSKAES